MEMKDCCFEPTMFFEPGEAVWMVHCGRVVQSDVLAVRFDMVDEPGPGGTSHTLFVTGYRLYRICHNAVDGYFPLTSVYATQAEAEAQNA
ncbi:MAG: hypothetical protein WAT81_03200 [Candidatus Moraniibacteriota bacterium]